MGVKYITHVRVCVIYFLGTVVVFSDLEFDLDLAQVYYLVLHVFTDIYSFYDSYHCLILSDLIFNATFPHASYEINLTWLDLFDRLSYF